MKKRRLALLALVLTMVFITAFPLTAYAAEWPNTIASSLSPTQRTEKETLPNAHFPRATTPLYKGTIEIQYTTSGNPISYIEVDGVRVTSYSVIPIYYQVVPGVYRYQQNITFDVAGIVGSRTESSLITFVTGNDLYGIHVNWQ